MCDRSVSNGRIVSNVSSGVSDISIVSNVSIVGNVIIVRSLSSVSNVSIVCNSKKNNNNKKNSLTQLPVTSILHCFPPDFQDALIPKT